MATHKSQVSNVCELWVVSIEASNETSILLFFLLVCTWLLLTSCKSLTFFLHSLLSIKNRFKRWDMHWIEPVVVSDLYNNMNMTDWPSIIFTSPRSYSTRASLWFGTFCSTHTATHTHIEINIGCTLFALADVSVKIGNLVYSFTLRSKAFHVPDPCSASFHDCMLVLCLRFWESSTPSKQRYIEWQTCLDYRMFSQFSVQQKPVYETTVVHQPANSL